MTWNATLFRWRMRTLLPITLISGLMSGIYVLRHEGLLQWWFDRWGMCLVIAQDAAMATQLGRRRSPSEYFQYSHGFSRDTVWRHSLLAGMVSVFLAWLPAALLVWSPLREVYQDDIVSSEWFPFGAAFETAYPVHWLIHAWFWLAMFVGVRSTGPEVSSRLADVSLSAFVMWPVLFGRDSSFSDPVPGEQIAWTAIAGASAILLTVANRSRFRDVEVLP